VQHFSLDPFSPQNVQIPNFSPRSCFGGAECWNHDQLFAPMALHTRRDAAHALVVFKGPTDLTISIVGIPETMLDTKWTEIITSLVFF
jgi:hypothetical protein